MDCRESSENAMETSEMIDIIVRAIKRIGSVRSLNSERGYKGELKSRLDQVLREQNLLPGEAIVEEEYQKTIPNRGIKHRPDRYTRTTIQKTKNSGPNNYLTRK